MQTRDVLGFCSIPFALLLAAWLINTLQLWSTLANLTLPWLCTAIAISVLILGIVCLVLQVAPAAIPRRVAVNVVTGVLSLFGVGMLVDFFAYPQSGDHLASAGEWLGFAVILMTVFSLPYVHNTDSSKQ